ncbi:uncharacterized protein LOC34622549 [Cyclospora cayetanensis]|uniref:Uncharacterized protein LOC34622549 n=1 Tax=Cyclospora cayetanensis TaxID=88456 RepID=A0A6P6RZP1_9EIME|nr:uncharacterized protein LOC34622549 [Cyclospora cayetanensis]
MAQRTQNTEVGSTGASSLSSRVASLLAAARHGPFAVQAKKAVKLLEGPTAHVRNSGLHKLRQLVLQFSHLHKERQVALELLLLALEHGDLSAEDAARSPIAIATVFNGEHQLPCAAFLQPPSAAAAVQPAAAAAAAAGENLLRLSCRSEALGCLIDLIEGGALELQQLIDALHARLAAAGNKREAGSSNNNGSVSSEELLPRQMQLLLVQRLLELALEGKLLPASVRQPKQDERQQQLPQVVRLQQAAAALRDALIRISHFCPRVCIAAVEAVSCVLEAVSDRSTSSSEVPEGGLPSVTFTALLEPTLLVSMQLLLNSTNNSTNAASCSLLPLAVARLLRCMEVVGNAEIELTARSQKQQLQQQKQQAIISDSLLHLSLSALLRVKEVEEFSCCFSAALQSIQLRALAIAALHNESDACSRGPHSLLLLQQRQQQARANRLLWECVCRLCTAREQQQDLTSLLRQLLRCLDLFISSRLPNAAAAASASRSGSSSACSTQSRLSLGMWRIACATVGWLLWSAAVNETNTTEVPLLLQAASSLRNLQPQVAPLPCSSRMASSAAESCCPCIYRQEALQRICCLSPLLLLLVPLVTQQQLGAGGERCRAPLTEALQKTSFRAHALLACAAAAAAKGAAAAAEGSDCCGTGACRLSFDLEELFGLEGPVEQTSGAAAALPLAIALWSFRILDWGAAEQLLGRESLAAADRLRTEEQQQERCVRDTAAAAKTAGEAVLSTGGQLRMLFSVLLRRGCLEDLHSASFLLSLPSALLQQGPYSYLVACCFLAESLHDRQQAFAAVNALVAAAPAAALQLLPALHFAALRLPSTPVLRVLIRWKQNLPQEPQLQQPRTLPLLPDELILFDGDEALALIALAAAGGAGDAVTEDCTLQSVAAERWELLRSISRVFSLSLQALASLGLHKTAVLPAYRALHDLLPLNPEQQRQQQQQQHTHKMESLSSAYDEWLCAARGPAAELPGVATSTLCCCRAPSEGGAAAVCTRCLCCAQCCWCSGDHLGALASCLAAVSPYLLLSGDGRWFLLMRSLTRLSAFEGLPFSKLAAPTPLVDVQQGTQEGGTPSSPKGSTEAAGLPAAPAAAGSAVASAASVPFILPENASPLQHLLLAFCLQRLEAVSPQGLLQFLPAMEHLVAACTSSPPLRQQQLEGSRQPQQHGASGQKHKWLLERACGVTLSTLGRLCMRRFLEPSKILRVLRRKCQFLFNALQAPPGALDGCILVLYALSQDLAEKIEHHWQQEKHERLQHQQHSKTTDSGLPSELEGQVQEQLLLLEEVAEAGSSFARSVALFAASFILGPLYAASADADSGSVLRAPAGEVLSVRFACSEGIGAVVLHLPLRQLEVRGAACLLAAAMRQEQVTRGSSTAQTPAEMLRHHHQQLKLGTVLSKTAAAAAGDAGGDAQSERALIRLLFLSKPRACGATGGTAHERRELEELRAHAQQEARDIARRFVTAEPLLLVLLPRICGFFVRRYITLIPPAVAADGELLQLGLHLLQQLEMLMPHVTAGEEQLGATPDVLLGALFPAGDPSSSSSSDVMGFGIRFSEFSVLASLLSALAAQQPALIPSVTSFFSTMLHNSSPVPPPWLTSCSLLALAPLHATSADISDIWMEWPEGQEGAAVFASLLRGFNDQTDDAPQPAEIQQCLCGGVGKAGHDLLAGARCVFLVAHAQHNSGDPLLLGTCLRALCFAISPTATLFCVPSAGSQGNRNNLIITAELAIAIAEISRVVHLQTPDPTCFYPHLLELYKKLETLLLSSASPQGSQWNALLALGSLLPIILEAGVLPLDEALWCMQRIEEILEQGLPEPCSLAYAGLAHMAHSLLPLLLLLQRRPRRVLRLQQQVSELQRLLLHFEEIVRQWLEAPVVGAVAKLARAFAAAALTGAPFLLLDPTQAAMAQTNAGATGLTSVSLALYGADPAPGTLRGRQQQPPQELRQQQGKQSDASAAVVEYLVNLFCGHTSSTSVASFGGIHGAHVGRGQSHRDPDLAGSMVLGLLYIQLTSYTAEGSLASLPKKSLTRLALEQLLRIREGQEFLLPEGLSSVEARLVDGATAADMRSLAEEGTSFNEATVLKSQPDAVQSEFGEALGWTGLIGAQREGGGASGLPIQHCICLLEALACSGVPAFSELQLGRRLALLFARATEATRSAVTELAGCKGLERGVQRPAPGFADADSSSSATYIRINRLLKQLQGCASLQLGVLRFCCRHCYRLPQLAALFVGFAHAGFGIAGGASQPAAQEYQQQQLLRPPLRRSRRFTAAVAYYFFALLPAVAGALSPRELSSLLGGVLLRGLLPPAEEPLLWCSALHAVRRILECTRRGVCCIGKETQQRKRWELQQQQRKRRLHCSQVETEVPLYIFPSVSHKLRYYRELHQLITLWIMPLLSDTATANGKQRLLSSPEKAIPKTHHETPTEPDVPKVVAAAAAARRIPFAVWGTAAEALIAFLLLRRDCLLVQTALNEEDVASLTTPELQSKRRQHFLQQQEQEARQLMEQLSFLPAFVVVYLVLSGVAPLELVHRKRRMLIFELAPSAESGLSFSSSPQSTMAAIKGPTSGLSEEPDRSSNLTDEDDYLSAEVAALCCGCAWLPLKEQVEMLEAFACSGASGGSRSSSDVCVSSVRCFIGFVTLAAHMVAPHLASLILPAIDDADDFVTTGERMEGSCLRPCSGKETPVGACHLVQGCGGSGLSLCGELAAFPTLGDDVVEREDSLYNQVAESSCMYTSQRGIKHLLLMHHRWLCYMNRGSNCHECCLCSPVCSLGRMFPQMQLVIGSADGRGSGASQCLEPLLLTPAAFAGARGFFCMSFAPNIYLLSSLTSHSVQQGNGLLAQGTATVAPGGDEMTGNRKSCSLKGKLDALSLCNELVAECEATTLQEKKALYGEECHEDFFLERRDAVLLQAHLPSSLMHEACYPKYLGYHCPSRTRARVSTATLFAATETLAPSVVRLLYDEAQRYGGIVAGGMFETAESGRHGSSLAQRLRILAARLQRVLAEAQAARDSQVCSVQ